MPYLVAVAIVWSAALVGCGKTEQESKPYTSSALDAIQNPVQEGETPAKPDSDPRK